MRISLGRLKWFIRQSLVEGKHVSIRNVLSPARSDRETLNLQKTSPSSDDEDDIAPHLRDQEADYDQGPVPPQEENDPFAMTDPYSQDWHVLPRPSSGRH